MDSGKKIFAASCCVLLYVASASAQAGETRNAEYLSDWWHQSVNVVGSYHTRFGPQLNNDFYLEYEAFAKKDWLDFYGYVDVPKFFGVGNTPDRGIWDKGSPLFMEIEPRFSIDKLTGCDLSFGPFKEWYFANNYIYDMGHNSNGRQNTWFMGVGTDINTGLPMSLSINAYAKYQWENYQAANENSWDGYRIKVKYFVPLTQLWGGDVSYIGFTNFDFGSNLNSSSRWVDEAGKQVRSGNSIASSHVLALNYDHLHYSFVARYFHNGGQWNDGADIGLPGGAIKSTGWGYYFVAGYSF